MDKNNQGRDQTPSQNKDTFQSTRVFVQHIPPHISWQTLKDHFRTAGNVVFASVSLDPQTHQSKGHGIVQYETSDEAQKAIQIMRNYPMDALDGSKVNLYVREDHQESRSGGGGGGGGRSRGSFSERSSSSSSSPYTQRSVWKCANDSEDDLTREEASTVISIIKARDAARKRRNYDAADNMREQLKSDYQIHLDDRLKLWWKDVSLDRSGTVPQAVQDLKGEGHWKNSNPSSPNFENFPQQSESWRQIPTTPEKDACVDPNLVNGT